MDQKHLIRDSTPVEAQAIRRACMTWVSSMAVHWIFVRSSDPLMTPDVLLGRLETIPWMVDADTFAWNDACDCDSHCPKCSISGTVQMGPGVLRSESLHPLMMPGIVVTRVSPTQYLDFDWVVTRGRNNLKHSAVTQALIVKPIATFDRLPDIENVPCPTGVFTRTGIHAESCMYCGECGLNPKPSTTDFIVEIESLYLPNVLERAYREMASVCRMMERALPQQVLFTSMDPSEMTFGD